MNDDDEMVLIPRRIVERALRKARSEYCHVAAHDPGPPSECWHEFEMLADALHDAVTT